MVVRAPGWSVGWWRARLCVRLLGGGSYHHGVYAGLGMLK